MTEADQQEWEERAAIMEYDGELPKEQAEKLAFSDLEFKRNLVRAKHEPATDD